MGQLDLKWWKATDDRPSVGGRSGEHHRCRALMWLLLVIAGAVGRPQGKFAKRVDATPTRPFYGCCAAWPLTEPASGCVCIRLDLLLAYLAMPIDLIPDFIRWSATPTTPSSSPSPCAASRRMGIDKLRRHWPGTEDGLADLCRLTGSRCPPETAVPSVVLPIWSLRLRITADRTHPPALLSYQTPLRSPDSRHRLTARSVASSIVGTRFAYLL